MGTNAYTRPAAIAVDISERNNTEALLISDMAVNKTGIANDTYRMVIKHSDGTTVRVPVMVGTRLNTEAVIGPIGDANTQLTFSDDALNITCGGVSMMDFVEAGTDYVNVPVEFRAGGLVAGGMVKADAGTGALVVATPDVDYATKEYVDLAAASITLDEFFSDTASDLGGVYKVMDNTQAASANIVSAAITTDTTTTIYSFATLSGEPGLDRLLKGIYDFHLHLLKSGNKTITIQAQLYKRILAGDETLIGTSEISEALGTTSADYDLHMVIDPEVALLTTDRLVVKVLAISTGPAGSTTVTMAVGGTSDSHFTAPVSAQSLTNIFVPYTGATADVNLGDYKLGIGVVPTNPLQIQKDQNTATTILVQNNTGGSGGATRLSLKYITQSVNVENLNNGYTTDGVRVENSACIYTSGNANGMRIFTYDNYPLILGTNKEEALRIIGGLLGLGCIPSGTQLDIKSSTDVATIYGRVNGLNHGMTDLYPADVHGVFDTYISSSYRSIGGLKITGLSADEQSANALILQGFGDTTGGRRAKVVINGAQKSGGGIAGIADGDKILSVRNASIEKVSIKGNGDITTSGGITGIFAAESTDVDKFLVDSSGAIKYRTGAQVLSDIGAAAASHNQAWSTITARPTTTLGYGITRPASFNVTLQDDELANLNTLEVADNGIVIINLTGGGNVYVMAHWGNNTVTFLHSLGVATTDTDGSTCLYYDSGSGGLVLKNRTGSANVFSVTWL